MPFYTDIVRCSDASYYVGHTDDLEKRISDHNIGGLSAYTRKRRPVKLVFSHEFQSREETLARERPRTPASGLVEGEEGGADRRQLGSAQFAQPERHRDQACRRGGACCGFDALSLRRRAFDASMNSARTGERSALYRPLGWQLAGVIPAYGRPDGGRPDAVPPACCVPRLLLQAIFVSSRE